MTADMPGWKVQELLRTAADHEHFLAGFPLEMAAGECEICDIYWLLKEREGDREDNLFNLRDALAETDEDPLPSLEVEYHGG